MKQHELQERILSYMQKADYKPLTADELVAKMALLAADRQLFPKALAKLLEKAAVIKTQNDHFDLPERLNIVVGRLSMSAKGFGFIITDKAAERDIFVSETDLGGAMHGDLVAAHIVAAKTAGRLCEGKIFCIIERVNNLIVGTFKDSLQRSFLLPDDRRIGDAVFIPKGATCGAKDGMKVVVGITKWPKDRKNAVGEVKEILGKASDPGVDVLSLMRRYGLLEEFSQDAAIEAAAIKDEVTPDEYSQRRDRRNFRIVTIDGEDAKDLDDGVYAEQRPDDSFFLGVYIADVSYYVRENSPLDREARERATSVYLVDRVLPMLPKELSNGICSLNEGKDRLVLALEMNIAKDGSIKSYEIMPAVICVYRRLSYTLVNDIFSADKEKDVLRAKNADLIDLLEPLRKVHDAMKKARYERGAIDFDIPEVKVKLDESGKPIALIKRVGSLAESIIEQCMLAANETVAEHMKKKEQPFIYRVHEQPSKEKIEQLNDLLATLSLHLTVNEAGEAAPKDVQQLLEKVKKSPAERIVSAVALRSMHQARYDVQSLGHYGLSAPYYTHFTSPIRRYPDLIVHRLLRETLANKEITPTRKEQLLTLLPKIAAHASARERIAIEAERETQTMKKIEYMAQFVGDSFSGVISGVTAFGIFCELDNGVEGLVHVSSMINDYYEYKKELYALVGAVTNTCYRLGDPVCVVLVRANIAERTLDFVLKDNGVFAIDKKKPAIAAKKPRSAAKNKAKAAQKKKGDEKFSADEIIATVKSRERTKKEAANLHRKKHAKNSKGKKAKGTGKSIKKAPKRQKKKIAAEKAVQSTRPKAFWMPPPKEHAKKRAIKKPLKSANRAGGRRKFARSKDDS